MTIPRTLSPTVDPVDGFMAFYDATCDAAYRLACCLTGDPSLAGDVVIRAYVRAYGSVPARQRERLALILGLIREELAEADAELRLVAS